MKKSNQVQNAYPSKLSRIEVFEELILKTLEEKKHFSIRINREQFELKENKDNPLNQYPFQIWQNGTLTGACCMTAKTLVEEFFFMLFEGLKLTLNDVWQDESEF